jgi:16S rRNA (uracil1498-N3)-methyltransferase
VSIARFFVDGPLAEGEVVGLPAAVAHHATHVLRLREGDAVVLFNGRGGEFHGRLLAGGKQAELLGHEAADRESPLAITLLQSWVATDKLEWVVEKAVELGVARIVIAPARRSVVRLDPERAAKRLDRLQEIAISACCQCGRNRIPPVQGSPDLAGALADAAAKATGLMLHPAAPLSVVDVARGGMSSVAVAIGPEGGFDDGELALAERLGYRPARLGPRVLRTETAGLAAIASLQVAAGDLG